MNLIKESVAKASEQVKQEGLTPRVISLDEKVEIFATADIREDRVNLFVKNGVVVETSRG